MLLLVSVYVLLTILCLHCGETMSEGSWYFEENFTGVSDEFFDDVVNLLDLPPEDVEKNVEEEDWNTQFQRLGEPCFDIFNVPKLGLCSNTPDDCSLAPNKPLPPQYNDIAKLRQHPEASEDLSDKSIRCHNELIDVKDVSMLHIYSPVSVFESSSSCSVDNPTFDLTIPIKGSRSKRRRISHHSPLFSTPFIFSIPAFKDSENLAACGLQLQTHSGVLTNASKKRQRKELSQISGSMGMKKHGNQDPAGPRTCMHCEVTNTPQWREGPMGPKTLCNACGVRYRSGRLFPEYRPAASPTFVAALHSNCHKKVIEMRSKANKQARIL